MCLYLEQRRSCTLCRWVVVGSWLNYLVGRESEAKFTADARLPAALTLATVQAEFTKRALIRLPLARRTAMTGRRSQGKDETKACLVARGTPKGYGVQLMRHCWCDATVRTLRTIPTSRDQRILAVSVWHFGCGGGICDCTVG